MEYVVYERYQGYLRSDAFKFFAMTALLCLLWFGYGVTVSEVEFSDPLLTLLSKLISMCLLGILGGIAVGLCLLFSELSYLRYAFLYLTAAGVALYLGLLSLFVSEAIIIVLVFTVCHGPGLVFFALMSQKR